MLTSDNFDSVGIAAASNTSVSSQHSYRDEYLMSCNPLEVGSTAAVARELEMYTSRCSVRFDWIMKLICGFIVKVEVGVGAGVNIQKK